MSNELNVVDSDQNDGGQPNDLTNILPDDVKDLVGPGKKYADVGTALKALKFSQEHIARLEAEARERNERVESSLTIEQVHEKVQELLAQERVTSTPSGLDETKVASLFDQKFQEQQKRAEQVRNVALVKEQLSKKYGAEKFAEVFKAKATEIGVGVDFLNSLAATAPAAVLEYFKDKSPTVAPSYGSLNSAALNTAPKASQEFKSVMGNASTADTVKLWQDLKKKYTG